MHGKTRGWDELSCDSIKIDHRQISAEIPDPNQHIISNRLQVTLDRTFSEQMIIGVVLIFGHIAKKLPMTFYTSKGIGEPRVPRGLT